MGFLPNNMNGGGISPGAVSNQPAPMPGRMGGGFVGNGQLYNGGNQQAPTGMFRGL